MTEFPFPDSPYETTLKNWNFLFKLTKFGKITPRSDNLGDVLSGLVDKTVVGKILRMQNVFVSN